ncbi:uridylate kinase [Colletotrichum tofieldiae]|nr:uridylate kinase [Colletotrichum tofieldiae]
MHSVAPRLLSRASTSSSSIRSNVLTSSRSSFRLQQRFPARRFYSSEPPKKSSGIKFWPFLAVVGAGSLAYKFLVDQRAVMHVIQKLPILAKASGSLDIPSTPTFSASDVTVLFVLGGPGAGKGTQCAKLVSDYGFTHLSAGDLLRAEQDRPGSQFGQLIKDYIKDGLIVPMEVTVQLLENAMTETIKKQGNKRFLIDGFPRKMDQAIKFEETVCPAKLDVMESRLLERGKTSGRADDNAESIRKRFRTFVETSMPVVDYYEKQGRVVKLDATPTPQDVYAKTRAELNKRLGL